MEKLLSAAGPSLAEFEALRVGESGSTISPAVSGFADASAAGWRAAWLSPIPVQATAGAGEWGQEGSGIELTLIDPSNPVDRINRPPSLAGDRESYAVTVMGDTMWPRFRPGRRLLVSPASAVGTGDDALVMLAKCGGQEGNKVLIKELVRRSAGFVELRQFNPDIRFRVDAAIISAIHKVVGEAI